MENETITDNNILVKITFENIDIIECINECKSSTSGALSIFIGTTRDNFEEKSVSYLEYEFHPKMAIKELLNICKKAKEDFSLNKILVIHRVGKVDIMEESILIISSSAHRADAIKSTSWVLEEVKKKVPIWKKEYYKSEEKNSETYTWK